MGCPKKVSLFICWLAYLFQCFGVIHCEYGVYSARYWNHYCNRTIAVPCYGGQLTVQPGTEDNLWQDNCSVHVTIDVASFSCWSLGHEQSIYLHIKEARLRTGNSVIIYDNGTMVKNMSGPLSKPELGTSLPSVAQLQSAWKSVPRLSVHFSGLNTLGSNTVVSETRLPQNFTVDHMELIYPSVQYRYYYCPSLGGYLRNERLCESDITRVNCPSSYEPTVLTDNPVYSSYSCLDDSYVETTISYEYPTPTPTTGYNKSPLAILAVVIIVLGVLLLIIVALVFARRTCCGTRADDNFNRPMLTNAVPGHHPRSAAWNQSGFAQPVSFNPAPGGTAVVLPPKPFMDAPPSYESVRDYRSAY